MGVVATGNGGNGAPDKHEVELWLAGVRAELERIEGAMAPLLAEQSRLREREELLLRLRQSFEASHAVVAKRESSPRELAPDSSVREYVQRHIAAILAENAGGPMHINDLHAKFLQRGLRVPGAGRPANLTAHLGRSDTIVSPQRGFYTLGGPDARLQKASRKRARRGRRR